MDPLEASIFKNASTLAPPLNRLHRRAARRLVAARLDLARRPAYAVFAPSLDSALVFVDLVTQAKEDNEPQFNRSAIAVGDLRAPPLAFAQLNASVRAPSLLVTQRARH
jgi:hypothetical protein